MSNKGIDFPQYRKLSNGKVFYKIYNNRLFDELQIVGKTAYKYSTEAEKYPEILKIQDLLNCEFDSFELSSALEYEKIETNFGHK